MNNKTKQTAQTKQTKRTKQRNEKLQTLTRLALLALALLLALPTLAAGKKIYYLHNDHLGTPQLATDGNQNVVWDAQYPPFGQATVDEDVDGDGQELRLNLRFPGQYFDPESGLHYNYYRDYDPETGRYIQSDPIGLEGGLNTYGYAYQNPTKFIDPLGLDAMCGPGFTWIRDKNTHGHGKCVPNNKPNERDCIDGSCNSLDPITNTQCFQDCMNDAASSKPALCEIASPNKVLKELCDKYADVIMCSEKCSKEPEPPCDE